MSTFTQIHLHVVFSTLNREPLIAPQWEERLFKYINGILKEQKCKLLAINGTPDHIHLLLGLDPTISVSKLIREVKRSSSKLIKTTYNPDFYWQEGYGAFSCSKSQIEPIRKYIKNQKNHHTRINSKNEFITILDKFSVDYNLQYIK